MRQQSIEVGNMRLQPILVLVVEDEPLVQMAAAGALEDAGFVVFEAANAAEAINILNANEEIKVVFTDVDMPGELNGLKLAAFVRERWPSTKVVITSGHLRSNVDELPAEIKFFAKPYNMDLVIGAIVKMI